MEKIKARGMENQAKVVVIDQKIDDLQEEKRILVAAITSAKAEYSIKKGEVSLLVRMDIDGIKDQIRNIETTNFKIRANNNREYVRGEAEGLDRKYQVLTAAISTIEQNRRDMLASTPMPVPGLSVSDSDILYNGIPLS